MTMNRYRFVLFLFAALSMLAGAARAQSNNDWIPPRTEYNQPDFQGLWGNLTLTPMERPRELGDKAVYTEAEALELERQALSGERARNDGIDPDRSTPTPGIAVGNEAEEAYTDFGLHLTRIDGAARTSLVVDTADGRYPFKAEGRRADIYGHWRAQGKGPQDGPEMFPIGERCLAANATMPPMQILPYNSNIQIVQNRDYVMILGEMVHDARIIRIDGEPLPAVLRNWFGDSVGHFEGNTLVVHTDSFRAENSNFRLTSSEQLEVDERFTRIGDNEILYSYTVTDPGIYTQPFNVEMVLSRMASDEQIYEFACHEGNYSMQGSLTGARHDESEAARRLDAQ